MTRVLQCDALTTNWLRNLRGVRKDDVVGQYVDVEERERVEEVSVSPSTSPLVPTPTHTWVGPTSHVCHACSFCQSALHPGDAYTVHFNRTLTTPFVVACGTCNRGGEKMR